MAQVCLKNKYGSTPLHYASIPGHMDLARFLIEYGADVSAKDENGSTPLHRASCHNNIDLARFLVEHGANASAEEVWVDSVA
jgi:ankyrin repeat protein